MAINSLPAQVMASSVSMGATFNSSSAKVSNVVGYSIQSVWSGGGSPVGTLKLQASNDDTNWSDITGATFSVSADGNNVFNVADCFYNFVRLVYTRTSGTGTLSASLVSKG